MKGQFIISLDFEKFWGVFDSKSLDTYAENLNAVNSVVEKLLTLADSYNVKLTFATVGFLFHESKEALESDIPKLQPKYKDARHSPYSLISEIPNDANSSSVYFALDTIKKIKANGNHEISTHTYCHYYCLEDGQSADHFAEDLDMAIEMGNKLDIPIRSIVFPRNQVNQAHLEICKDKGILAYRGNEKHTIYQPKPYKKSKKPLHRIMRIADAYFNITGRNVYNLSELTSGTIVNLASSYFLRPYTSKLSFLESFKRRRIKNGMTKAAKTNRLFHLWFHPHNFGKDIEKNLDNFETILKTYQELKDIYGFESSTMTSLAEELINIDK